MDSISELGKPRRSKTFPEASKSSHKEEPTTRARLTEEVLEQTSAIDPQTPPDRKRTKSSYSQRKHPSSAAFGNTTQRGNGKSRDTHGTLVIRASSDRSSKDSFRPGLLPSLTYPFKLKSENVKEEKDQAKAAAASSIRNNDPQKEKEYRRKLYHEHIQDFSYTRYVGSSRSHEDSTAELCTTNVEEIERRGRNGILKWMYVSSTLASVTCLVTSSDLQYLIMEPRIRFLDLLLKSLPRLETLLTTSFEQPNF